MKRLWLFAILALSAGFFTSCDPVEPPVDPVENFAPTISLLTTNPITGEENVFSSDATVEVDVNGQTLLFVGLNGEDFTDSLKTLEIFLNDEKVDESVASITAADGTDIGVNNPALLIAPYNKSFNFEVKLRTMEAYGVNTFRFLLTDSGNLTDEVSISITTIEPIPVGTDLSGNLSGVLLNSAGPPGTGGLDLDEGNGNIGSGDAAAEIRDNGIDTDQPVDANWLQTISTVNGAIIRTLNRDALPEAYDFAAVTTVEEVTAAWDTGNEVVGNSTAQLQVGDEFIVQNADGTRNYLLQVAEVNVVTTDNSDNYVFNIKY